jgi:RNA polymerase sigma-70 factor (ECF subfamily)
MVLDQTSALEMQGPPPTLRQVFAAELPRLYTVAYHMSGSRTEAFERLRELTGLPNALLIFQSPRPGDALLGLLARHIEEFLGRKAEKSFQILDDILRDDITHPIDINTRGIDGDFGRVHPLLWELKRTCLTSVLGCLPPGVRISFILTDLLGYSPAASAALLGINESAFRVRLTRARKRLDNYLAPLCQFVDKANPCNCEGRLGVALAKEFISFPPHTDDIPHAPHDGGPEFHEMGALYRALPAIALTEEQRNKLLTACPEEEEHLVNIDDLEDPQDIVLAGPVEPDHPAGPDEPAQPDDPIAPGPEPIHIPADPAAHG